MQIQVLISFDNSKEDRSKLARILNEYADQNVLVAAKGKSKKTIPSTDSMVEELSASEKKALDLAMKRAHEHGETPLADSFSFNRAEEIRRFVKENAGKFTVGQMATIMHQCYPDISKDRWVASGHAMCNPRQASYSFAKKDGKLIPIHG